MTRALMFRVPRSTFRVLCLFPLLAGRAEAQLDPSGSWRTLHTPHFRIHFRPAYRDVALTEAREAERAYALLATELRPPRGTVDLTLADDGDVANGVASVFPSSRITLFIAPPATDPGLQLYDSWLRLVTTHELTHVFHLDRAKSFWGVAQRVFSSQGPLLHSAALKQGSPLLTHCPMIVSQDSVPLQKTPSSGQSTFVVHGV